MNNIIGDLAIPAPAVTVESTNHDIDQLFSSDSLCQGIVVKDKNKPIAITTRNQFYQKIGTLYGYSLYMGRSISYIMNDSILVVDFTTPIVDVSQKAMARDNKELYDYIIVTKNDEYFGVVSIKDLLIKMAEVQAKLASYQNPLTGLPGNQMIDKKLKETLTCNQFCVIYVDIDRFKSYNDTYGFLKGDRVIQATAALLQSCMENVDGFLGHIGGDDFLIILEHYKYQTICTDLIRDFTKIVENAYSPIHLEQKYIISNDRNGTRKKTNLFSLSVAVATNQHRTYFNADELVEYATKVKKYCKSYQYSCYYVDQVKGC
ncbi:GGDEF domain-containing protein [Evansella tamaricis]|uniref:GGDEF domain-containing protein n=1 Tax=Evansella tamaricis TaxID=2069301 RepID=A0ABS6JD00_9BACI|nr:GGDEF domain-containing protein [Evansella tamaricis]MBU9711550.1 GGDEF domain-containing protein [Evansella tamaricis]